MSEEKKLDLRNYPNEFIVATYNIVVDEPIISEDFDGVFDEGKMLVDKDSDLYDFLTIISPACEKIVEDRKRECAKTYQETYVAMGQNSKPVELLSNSFERKMRALKENVVAEFQRFEQMKQYHEQFYVLLDMLYRKHSDAFNNYRSSTIRNKLNGNIRISIYPTYVSKTYEMGEIYDCYTKANEETLTRLINIMYSTNVSENEAGAEE